MPATQEKTLDFNKYQRIFDNAKCMNLPGLEKMRQRPSTSSARPSLCSVEALMYEKFFGGPKKSDSGSNTGARSSNPSASSIGASDTTTSSSSVATAATSMSSPFSPRFETPPTTMTPINEHHRNYSEIESRNAPLFTFGGEGTADGQLSRPWGICCDKRGRILVADRSNNRIQIFTPDGEFITKFGTYGTRTGELNRPAGITVNSRNNIIVADKDNHRIQAFTEDGAFILTFGGNGRQLGCFNYPWDVACNSRDEIAVSDTRNHRVQIFSSCGQFLRKYTFDSGFLEKNLYSPRGVCYTPDDMLIVTDFNGHRIAVIKLNQRASPANFYGTEGFAPGCFFRPQGVCLDRENNMLVVDSRCNRIQVFAPTNNMRLLAILGGGGGATSEDTLERPTDICVGLDGRIYVVDFGNNCIRVF